MKKIVILTGTELRHEFFRKFMSSHNDIHVLKSFCESPDGNLVEFVENESSINDLRRQHLKIRELVEKDFFEVFCSNFKDLSNPVFIKKGTINNDEHVKKIIELNPDLIISYGCSIIKSNLITHFKNKFINIHLGLSPYYRGSGTNYWPFVNNELQFIGTTFMYIDEGIDTGHIIHQVRANINHNDSIHQIGNRLIKDTSKECVRLIRAFHNVEIMDQIKIKKEDVKYYRKKDFTEESLHKAYNNCSNESIDKYLKKHHSLVQKFPIITNTSLTKI